jgi:phosphonate degradation associated HDIG domain protein
MTIVDQILSVYSSKGHGLYFGEAVTEMAHALQCAHLAKSSGANDPVVAAALVHDIGHLLHDLPENVAEQGVDAHHEDAGAAWLKGHFPREVVDPVRLHVAAKRYLCAVDPFYQATLSPASTLSLKLQGGPMSAEEIRQFEREPHFRAAVAVRRWDDGAKVSGLDVPGIEQYRTLLERVSTAAVPNDGLTPGARCSEPRG